MRLLVTILGFVVALLVFRFFVEEAWPSAIFLGVMCGLIAGPVLTPSGWRSLRRIARNLKKGWS